MKSHWPSQKSKTREKDASKVDGATDTGEKSDYLLGHGK